MAWNRRDVSVTLPRSFVPRKEKISANISLGIASGVNIIGDVGERGFVFPRTCHKENGGSLKIYGPSTYCCEAYKRCSRTSIPDLDQYYMYISDSQFPRNRLANNILPGLRWWYILDPPSLLSVECILHVGRCLLLSVPYVLGKIS